MCIIIFFLPLFRPSIDASDITQYEEIDNPNESHANIYYFSEYIQSRPLPAPPRPPRDKRPTRSPAADHIRISRENSRIHNISPDASLNDYVIGAEMGTQTSIDFDDGIETINSSRHRQAATVRNGITDNDRNVLNMFEVDPSISKEHPSKNIFLDQLASLAGSSMNCEEINVVDDAVQIHVDDEKIISEAIRRYQLLGNSNEDIYDENRKCATRANVSIRSELKDNLIIYTSFFRQTVRRI